MDTQYIGSQNEVTHSYDHVARSRKGPAGALQGKDKTATPSGPISNFPSTTLNIQCSKSKSMSNSKCDCSTASACMMSVTSVI